MKLDDTVEQLRATVGFVRMAKDAAHTPAERHGYLMFAVMHTCQAAIHNDRYLHRFGLTIHDYKHILIKAAESVMNGVPIGEVMIAVDDYPLAEFIDWNYFNKD